MTLPIAFLYGCQGCKLSGSLKGGGIFIHDAKGRVEACELAQNALAGIECKGPSGGWVFSDCIVRDNASAGAFIHAAAKGTFERCRMLNNSTSADVRDAGTHPAFIECNFSEGRKYGVKVLISLRNRRV